MKKDTPESDRVHYHVNLKPLVICLIFGCAMWFSPHPTGISAQGWHVLSIFMTTILAVIVKPLPMGGVALVSLSIGVATGSFTQDVVFSAFSSKIVWLVLFALFIAKGFAITGLGERIAYIFTRFLGKSALGLSYGLVASDLMMAWAIPSVTGRIAGIVFPILQGISNSFESMPNSPTARRIGAFLTVSSFQCTSVTCAMFMTAMAANPVLTNLTSNQGYEVTWGMWALAGILPGLISLALIPLVVYKLYPPELKATPMAPQIAKDKLKEMGAPSIKEWILGATVIFLLVLWMNGQAWGIHGATAAMYGIAFLVVTGVLNWKTLLKVESAWETFLWFSTLLMMASQLNETGVITWFSEFIATNFSGLSWKVGLPIIALLYFYTHYFFASATAHVMAMYVPLLVVAVGLGTPPMLAAMTLIFASNLMGGLTHYSLAPAPLLFGAGYVDIKDWWRIGFVVSVLNIAIWGTIGLAWWKFIGIF